MIERLSLKSLLLLSVLSCSISLQAQFNPPQLLHKGHGTIDAAIMLDLDSNGILDVVSMRRLTSFNTPEFGGLYVHKGNMDNGELAYSTEFIPDLYFDKFWAFDMNQDGYKEVIAHNWKYFSTGICFYVIENNAGQISITDQVPGFLKAPCSQIRFVLDMDDDAAEDIFFFDTSYKVAMLFEPGNFNIENVTGIPDYTMLDKAFINQDRFPDFLLEDEQQDDLYLAISDGAFSYHQVLMDSTYTGSEEYIGMQDWRGDGKIEIAYFKSSAKEIRMILPNADDSYPTQRTVTTNQQWNGFYDFDFNADGFPDIYITQEEDPLLINDGTGNFTAQQVPSSFEAFGEYLYTNVDTMLHKGELFYFRSGKIKILRYENGDHETSRLPLPVVNIEHYYQLKDANEDGLPDLVFPTLSGVSYLPGQADKTFGPMQHIILDEDFTNDFTFADFNHDGHTDIAFTNTHPGTLKVRYGTGNGYYCCQETLMTDKDLMITCASGDFEGDSFPDLLACSRIEEQLYYLRNHNGIFSPPEIIVNDIFDLAESRDLDHDGDLDVFGENGGQLINDGTGLLVREYIGLSGSRYGAFKDLDHDGIEEYMEAHYELNVYKLFGSTYQLWRTQELIGGGNFELAAYLDYDGDGFVDFIGRYILDDHYVLYKNFQNKYWAPDGLFQDRFGFDLPDNFDIYDFTDALDLGSDHDDDIFFERNGSVYACENLSQLQSIKGTAYWDVNQDSLMNPGEIPIRDIKMSSTLFSLPIHTYTDQAGEFNITADTGIHSLQISPLNNCWQPHFNNPLDVYVKENENTVLQLPFILEGKEIKVTSTLSHGITRCQRPVQYHFQIINDGCKALKGTATIRLADKIEFFTPNIFYPYTISGNEIIIQVDTFLPGYTAEFNILVRVPTVDTTGETMSHSLVFEYGAMDGSTTGQIHEKTFPEVILCALDPNDKVASPDRSLMYDAAYVENEDLLYTIRFQNTGNDTAFNVVLVDTLSEKLDLETFRIIDASHSYRTRLDLTSRTLTVYFDQILLPDSTIDFVGSNGFFSFSIRPAAGMADYTSIQNTASIYFDFNAPVVTNTVELVFVTDLSILETSNTEIPHLQYSIDPNPSNGTFRIQPFSTDLDLSVYNMFGQEVAFNKWHEGIRLIGSAEGIYWLVIRNGQEIKTGKLVVTGRK